MEIMRMNAGDAAGTAGQAGTDAVPTFVEIFAGVPPESFMHFFPGGKFMKPMLTSFKNTSPKIKRAFVEAARGIFESGQIENLKDSLPSVLEILKTFTEKNLTSITICEKEVDPAVVSELRAQLTSTLGKNIAESNTKQLVETLESALLEKPVRRLLFFALCRYNWTMQGEWFKLLEKPWTKEESYNTDIVPEAPLKRKDTGPKVLHLQYCLVKTGQMSPDSVTRWRVGTYDPPTASAIAEIQKQNNVSIGANGEYDKATAMKLRELVASSPVGNAEEPISLASDMSTIFWLMSSFTPLVGGWHKKGGGVRKQRPGPWMTGGMPLGPRKMRKVHKLLSSVSEETRGAIEAAGKSVWSNGQMPSVFSTGPIVFRVLKRFTYQNIGCDTNPKETVAAEKIDGLKQTLKEKLSAGAIKDETIEKILLAVEKTLGEVSVRRFLKKLLETRKEFEEASAKKLKEKQWEQEINYPDAKAAAPRVPISPGDNGLQVIHLHSALVELGKMSTENVRFRIGYYGDYTMQVVKKIQKESNILEQVEAAGSYDAVTATTITNLLAEKNKTPAPNQPVSTADESSTA